MTSKNIKLQKLLFHLKNITSVWVIFKHFVSFSQETCIQKCLNFFEIPQEQPAFGSHLKMFLPHVTKWAVRKGLVVMMKKMFMIFGAFFFAFDYANSCICWSKNTTYVSSVPIYVNETPKNNNWVLGWDSVSFTKPCHLATLKSLISSDNPKLKESMKRYLYLFLLLFLQYLYLIYPKWTLFDDKMTEK